jgi:V/A-type H+-transporting ATPase subunit I
MVGDPDPEDEDVPTKTKNSRAVQIFRPIMSFLDLSPGYREPDVTGWFLMFFCIFFGLIFGDAGYGLLLLFIAVIGMIKTAKKGVPEALKLLFVLGLTNTAWGVLTCSWLGMAHDRLPQFLRDISLAAVSTAKSSQVIVDQNMQIFCFSLALLHLGTGRIISLFKCIRQKNPKMFAHIGSLGMILGMFNLILVLVVSNSHRSFPLFPVSLYLIAAGVLLSFVFGYYEGNLLKSLLNGVANLMTIILGVTNVFADIMSYIRLWAVGLAGAAIATIVSDMAYPMLGNFLIFVGIIVMVFGHGLNIVLSVLSMLIHGVRLNTLEFSGHAGVTWSGIQYKPFAETKRI